MIGNLYLNSKCLGFLYDRGLRDNNQDSLCLQQLITVNGETTLMMICDGLGGLISGEIASGYLCEIVSSWFYNEYLSLLKKGKKSKVIISSLITHIYKGHNELLRYGRNNSINLGSTLSLLLVRNNIGIIIHIGDSSIYRIRNGRNVIKRLTPLHLASTNTLSHCLGFGKFYKPYIKVFNIKRGDIYIVCSDGFYHYVDFSSLIKSLINQGHSEESICKCLRTQSRINKNKGEKDNMSALVIRY